MDGIEKIRNQWVDEVRDGAETPCPVCRAVPNVKRHSFKPAMALSLIHLHHVGETTIENAPGILKPETSLPALELWDFVICGPKGRYRLSPIGHLAVRNQANIARYCWGGNGILFKREGPFQKLGEYLSPRYDYDALMEEAE